MKTKTFAKSLSLSFLLALPVWADQAGDYKEGGMALYRAGQYAKAVDYLQKAVQADPNDAETYQDLGDAYLKMGEDENARSAYQKSLEINPNNATVRASLDSLGGATTTAPPASNPPTGVKKFEEGGITQRPAATYAVEDGKMSPIDRSKFWFKFGVGYNYAFQNDLLHSADIQNQVIASNSWLGSAVGDHNGYFGNGALGFLFNPNVGMEIGLSYVQTNDQHYDVNLRNGPSTVSGTVYSSDFENETLSPSAWAPTLDFYLFLPDSTGRFFVSAGGGLYVSTVHVEDDYSYVIANQDPNSSDTFSGDLTATGVGVQFGAGREFAIGRRFGISIFGRYRIARLTNFRGTVNNPNTGGTANVGLARFPDGEVFATDVSNIGSGGTSYATIDFTGFDVGASLNFYTF